MTLAYFCLSALDLLDAVETKLPGDEQEGLKDWIYAQQIRKSLLVTHLTDSTDELSVF